MGRRSATKSVVDVLAAFLRERTWKQAELARVIGVSTATVRRLLEELDATGFPLEREEDPPHVYWTLPNDYFPDGLFFRGDDAKALMRLLRRLPKSNVRDRLLARAMISTPQTEQAVPSSRVVSTQLSSNEEKFLDMVEDGCNERRVLSMRYYAASRPSSIEEWRNVSIQRVLVGPPTRFLAYCHRDSELKWFRVDGIFDARIDSQIVFQDVSVTQIDSFVGETVGGFHGSGNREEVAFSVEPSISRWVRRNLPPGMMISEQASDGIRVVSTTAAVEHVARYCVGLGDRIEIESPALRIAVENIARSALRAVQPAADSTITKKTQKKR